MDLVTPLLKALRVLSKEKKDRRALVNVALSKTSLALRETEYYYQDHKRDGANFEAQRRIAELWSDAAIAMRDVNSNLAKVFHEKSAYHSVYGIYPKTKMKQMGIELASVRKKYQELFETS